jgi:hypothetical protein
VRVSLKPESAYTPMASSLAKVVAGVDPELTAWAEPVVPVAWALWSTTLASATVDSPEYSSAVTPMSAADDTLAVMVGLVPPRAVMGALHTLISVLSEAVKWVSSTKVSPAESLTPVTVGPALFQAPTSTTSRLAAVIAEARVTARLVLASARALICCTNAGVAEAVGVTALELADGGPVPTALVAVTTKV